MRIAKGNPCLMGVVKIENQYNFAMESDTDHIILLLYKKGTRDPEFEIQLDDHYKTGNVFSVSLYNVNLKEYQYRYKIDEQYILDPYAKTVSDCYTFGRMLEDPLYVSCVELEDFDWEGDSQLFLPFCDSILYKLHVRGFTKSAQSNVSQKGTFGGIIEKIPYFKELGITTIQLMPPYEFDEISRFQQNASYGAYSTYPQKQVNYWGYTHGFHFAVKSSFCHTSNYSCDFTTEFKHMVKELHRHRIEVIIELYFAKESAAFIKDCVRFWVLEYHVDGVHLYCDKAAFQQIANDPLLAKTKIISDYEYNEGKCHTYKNIAISNNHYSNVMKRYLRGDEDQLGSFIHAFKNNPSQNASLNYITNHNGFTLYDLVSYERKHNEANGEANRDGENYNYSWNCGVEGDTDRIHILKLRQQQIKNAWMLLLLSQGTPMIYAGDEFENSQGGNNNPYCLDNETSWVSWNTSESAKEILDFVKQLIIFRKSNKILHMPEQLLMTDYQCCGYPDISFHGEKAWYSQVDNYFRHVGILLCSRYAYDAKTDNNQLIYLAFNMHTESHELALPAAGDTFEWKVILQSSIEKESQIINQKYIKIVPKSILVLMGPLNNELRRKRS